VNAAELQDFGPRLPALARDAILAWAEGRDFEPPSPDPPALPCFVTLRNPDESLRGCIGRLDAACKTLFAEVARNAVLAAKSDPRFEPVKASEVAGLRVEVSVLSPPEPIRDLSDLDPATYGVIVSDALGRQGVLLPNVPGIEDAASQVAIAAEKGGMDPLESAGFQVERFVTNKFLDVVR
jgi:AmmeMemoRadiSam system protein A